MSNINISPLGRFNGGLSGRGAQVFGGSCVQDRVDAAITGAFQPLNSPVMTVSDPSVFYLAFYLPSPALVYVGNGGGATLSAAIISARAQAFGAGWWAVEARVGDRVYVRDL